MCKFIIIKLINSFRTADSEKNSNLHGPGMKYPLNPNGSIPGTPLGARHQQGDMVEDMATDNPLWIDQYVNSHNRNYARARHTVAVTSHARRPIPISPPSAASIHSNVSFSNFRLRPSSSWQRNNYNFNTFSPKKLFVYKKYFFPYMPAGGTHSEFRNIYTRKRDVEF